MSLCRLPFLVYCSNAPFLKSTSGIAPGKMATIQCTQKCVPRGIKRIFLRLIWVVSTGWVCLILTGNVCHQKRILFFAAKSQLVEGGKKKNHHPLTGSLPCGGHPSQSRRLHSGPAPCNWPGWAGGASWGSRGHLHRAPGLSTWLYLLQESRFLPEAVSPL